MSTERPAGRPLRLLVPASLLALAVGYALLLHHGLGPRPQLPDSALRWWNPRGFLTLSLSSSSWDWLLERRTGMLVFGMPSFVLLGAVWLATRSAIARTIAIASTLAVLLFLFYGLGSGGTQVAWNFFHWRASVTMAAVALVTAMALASPWLAASWLRLGWPLRLAWLLPILGVVIAIERNVTGTNDRLPFAISPWPAVQVFGLEAFGTTVAAQLGGLALALGGLVVLRRGHRVLGAAVLLAGLALPSLAWLGLGSFGLLPFRVTPERVAGVAVVCAVLVALSALGVRAEPARLTRRARHCAVAAMLLGLPLLAGTAWARFDYTRTRDVLAERIIEALARYYERDGVYPDALEQLVEADLLAAVPRPVIGFAALADPGDGNFTYQGFGTSYLLEFSAPRWVQCAYNPPFDETEYEDDEALDEEGDFGGGSWSCPSKPPELW